MGDAGTGREALRHIDRALAGRPGRDGAALADAVRCLAAFRDEVVQRHRREGGTRYRATLDRVNAIVSVVLAAEFPLGEVPWAEVEKGRVWLEEILGDDAAQ